MIYRATRCEESEENEQQRARIGKERERVIPFFELRKAAKKKKIKPSLFGFSLSSRSHPPERGKARTHDGPAARAAAASSWPMRCCCNPEARRTAPPSAASSLFGAHVVVDSPMPLFVFVIFSFSSDRGFSRVPIPARGPGKAGHGPDNGRDRSGSSLGERDGRRGPLDCGWRRC